jgi:hypothetical protein
LKKLQQTLISSAGKLEELNDLLRLNSNAEILIGLKESITKSWNEVLSASESCGIWGRWIRLELLGPENEKSSLSQLGKQQLNLSKLTETLMEV